MKKDSFGNSCLLLASSGGYLDIVKSLIESGCSIDERNKSNDTCITIASREGYLEIIKYLVIEHQCSLQETRFWNMYSKCSK